jgi:hypothetical protein
LPSVGCAAPAAGALPAATGTAVCWIFRIAGAFRAAVHQARDADQRESDRDQDAEYGAENVDEMSILLRHRRIIASGRADL